jgi:hypothetical protein
MIQRKRRRFGNPYLLKVSGLEPRGRCFNCRSIEAEPATHHGPFELIGAKPDLAAAQGTLEPPLVIVAILDRFDQNNREITSSHYHFHPPACDC